MGLDELHLRVLATSSDDIKEKQNAQKVLRLMRRGRHWVLVVSFIPAPPPPPRRLLTTGARIGSASRKCYRQRVPPCVPRLCRKPCLPTQLTLDINNLTDWRWYRRRCYFYSYDCYLRVRPQARFSL